MAVRPFYLSAEVDGRKTDLSGGPRAKDGCMTTTISQRNEGCIEEPYRICQRSYFNEDTKQRTLETTIYFKGKEIHNYITTY